jgi:predicted GNAT family acetyltransferase
MDATSSSIDYRRTLIGIDWSAMTAALIADDFDNGRTPEQLQRSFINSALTVIAFDGDTVVGTARALSDGVCNAYIVDVWTLSSHRRRGIATAMMQSLFCDLSGQHVSLFTDDASEFYESLGMKPRGKMYEIVVGEWLQSRPQPDD